MGATEALHLALSRLRTSFPNRIRDLEARGVTLEKTRFVGTGEGVVLARRINEELARLQEPTCRNVMDKIVGLQREAKEPASSAAQATAAGKETQVTAVVAGSAPPPVDAQTLPSSAPDAEPAAPAATAQWLDQVPAEDWLPAALQELCGKELEGVCKEPIHLVCEPALPGWRVLAGTRRGRLHAHHGTFREDAFAHGGDREGGRFWIFCVCDGAGSSRLSRVGAEITCRGMVRRLSETLHANTDARAALDPAGLNEALRAAVVGAVQGNLEHLGKVAAAAGAEPKDFRCTLLLTILLRHGDVLLACLSQVGDGFIAGLTDDGAARRHAAPTSASGEFSGEVKCFVPDPDSPAQATPFGVIPNVANRRALLLCTDGIEDPFFPVDTHVGLIFQQFTGDGPGDAMPGVHWPEAPGGPVACADEHTATDRLARWLAFEKKGENDDRTVMFIHRAPATA